MEINKKDFHDLLYMATRYAIPRMSVAGGVIQDIFKKYINEMEKGEIEWFIKDIKKHVDYQSYTTIDMWHRVDRPDWLNLIEMLEKRLNVY